MNLVKHFINLPDLLEDEIKLKRILTDCFSGDKSKVNRMMAAHELGIVKMLMNNTFSEFERKKLINQLVDVYNMQMEKADDTIEEWKKIFSNDLIYAYSKYYSGKSSFDVMNYKNNANKNTVVITGNKKTSKIDLINAIWGREFINRYI